MMENNAFQGLWQPGNDSACWVFPARAEDTVNQLVDVHHVFACPAADADAELQISADTDFIVWLNGEWIGQGQYSDYPDQKTFERFPCGKALRAGRNALAVTVFYNGRDSSVYRRGRPGLVFAVRGQAVLAASGTQTLCRPNPCYHSGPIAVVSGQLSYTFGYDARGEDNFTAADYVPGKDWAAILPAEAILPQDRQVLRPRSVARLADQGLTACRLHSGGVFRRDLSWAEKQFGATAAEQTAGGLPMSDGTLVSPGWQMQHDHLAARSTFELFNCAPGTDLAARQNGLTPDSRQLGDNQGIYLVVDMGCQEVGYLDVDVEAAAGTMIDIGYGEHLDDLRVRTFVGGRSFAGRYICRAGRQQFSHPFLRWAGRYLAVHIHAGEFTVHRVSLRRRNYPVAVKAELRTGNAFHRRTLEVAQRTLALCMHEHYEDTPWREQALYANDARTQALCGYYAFGETAFPASSFALLGRGQRGDGYLYLTAPAKQFLTIPSFTFCWMLAVRDHYLYSGDASLAREFLPQIVSMLESFLAERRNGLLPLRREKGIWHFYDWSGMSRYSDADFAAGLDADAPLNCFFIMALEAAGEMLRWTGQDGDAVLATAADGLRGNVAARFWDAGEGLFRTHEAATTFTELTQALAVLAEVGEAGQRESALARMARKDSGLIRPGLSQTLYTFSALMSRKELFGQCVLEDIEETWGKMLRAGATTFWETIAGAADFHNAGSLCHAWSAVPLYIYYHDLLGLRPLEPGFRAFAIDPVASYLPRCCGTVPTPRGEISLSWEHGPEGVGYAVNCPDGCEPRLLDAKGRLVRR